MSPRSGMVLSNVLVAIMAHEAAVFLDTPPPLLHTKYDEVGRPCMRSHTLEPISTAPVTVSSSKEPFLARCSETPLASTELTLQEG